jgi:predicted nucleic acid-binding protein
MAFVLDSSVTLAWLLPDERSAALDALGDTLLEANAVVPAIWPYEIGNALRTAQKRARIGNADMLRLQHVLAALPIEVEATDRNRVLDDVSGLARELDITVYDAAYVELARRRALPVATLDEHLRRACARARIVLLV